MSTVWVIRSEQGEYACRDPKQRWTNNLDNAWKWNSRDDARVRGADWGKDVVPVLKCPNCGVALLPATHRGYTDDGEYIEHRDGCRCAYCNWTWLSDEEPVQCRCEAWVGVEIDDDCAYAVQVREPT